MLNQSLVLAITGYQKYLSPYKGFCCAHRVWHGDLSCSEYTKQTLLQNGVWRSLPKIRARFQACKAAALALSEQHNRERDNNRKKWRDKAGDFCECCNPLELMSPEGCSSFHIDCGGVDACACTP